MAFYYKWFQHKRSSEKELLDLGREYYALEEYQQCQKILFKISKLLGIYRDTIRFLKKCPATSKLIDIGCGGGLFLIHLSTKFPKMDLIGSDISTDAIYMAQNECFKMKCPNVSFNLSRSAKLEPLKNHYDILLANLVCHHIEDEELVHFLKNSLTMARHAVLINDLQRHVIAYYFYKCFSFIFNNRLISHDGLISIRRGFTRTEWLYLLDKADITRYHLKWRFPFRWSLILWKN